MKDNIEYIEKIINACDILIEGAVISKERILQEYSDFLTKTVFMEQQKVSVLLHTGSICFDAISLIFAAVSNWVYNTMTPEKIINALEVGDIVIYDKKRRIFKSKDDKYVKLETYRKERGHDCKDTVSVPKSLWNKITPYYGESEQADGRGIQANIDSINKQQVFLSQLLNIPESQLTSITDTSTVIVMSRDRADYLIDNLAIKPKFTDYISLRELVTASYFTENGEYPFGGNPGKTEPILKITGKVSVARRMIIRPENNRIIGLCVLGDEFLVSGRTELPGLINRKDLNYVLLSAHINTENMKPLFNEIHEPALFACTKDFLLSYSLPESQHNSFTHTLEMQIDHIINHDTSPVIIPSSQTWEQYSSVKRNLNILRNAEVSGEEKDYFVIQSYALIKLFLTAIFPIAHMEQLIQDKAIEIVSPQERVERLAAIAKDFPEGLREKAISVIDFIESLYIEVFARNEKEEVIWSIANNGRYKNVAVVVPKAYYRDVFFSLNWVVDGDYNCDITIATANQFKNNILYDCIVVSGIFDGKFNPFKCKTAMDIKTIIYCFEHGLYKYKANCAAQIERQYNKWSFFPVEEDNDFEELLSAEEIETVISDNNEGKHLEEYINEFNETALINGISKYRHIEGSPLTEIAAMARFNNGQIVFFSKAYKPYVLDRTGKSVVEVELKSLEPDNEVVFTQNNNETKDIVEAILADLILNDKLDNSKREACRKSKHWKHALAEYVERTGVSCSYISAQFAELGIHKGAGAIRDWIDPDSHTVGPRESDSYYAIALITDDADMEADPQSYCDACEVVRRIRLRILKQIGLSIISSVSGIEENDDPLFEIVSEKIGSLAQILKIESVVEVDGRTMPSALANKPLNIREE